LLEREKNSSCVRVKYEASGIQEDKRREQSEERGGREKKWISIVYNRVYLIVKKEIHSFCKIAG
jgi:hypothetical protein